MELGTLATVNAWTHHSVEGAVERCYRDNLERVSVMFILPEIWMTRNEEGCIFSTQHSLQADGMDLGP